MTNQQLTKAAYAAVTKQAQQHMPNLYDSRSEIREHAAEELGRLRVFEATPGLIRLLSDSDSPVRWAAIFALGSIGLPDAVPYLIPLLKDTDQATREATAYALGAIGPGAASAVEPLTDLLSDSESEVRVIGMEALGDIGSSEAMAALQKHFSTSLGAERTFAASAIDRIIEKNEDQTAVLDESLTATPDCPSFSAFSEAVLRRWPRVLREHIRDGCRYCSAMTATVWSVEFPANSILLLHALDNTTPSEEDISRFILDKNQRDGIVRMNSLSKLFSTLTRGIEGVQNLGAWSWRSERLTLALSHASSGHSAACSEMVEIGEDVRFSSSVDEGQRFIYFEAKMPARLTVIVGNDDVNIQPIVEEVQLAISVNSSESRFMYRAGLMLLEEKEMFSRFGPEYYVHVARMI